MTPPTHVSATIDQDIDLSALVGALWRRKLLISSIGLLAMLLSLFYALFIATPLYPATAVVALDGQEQQVISDIESVLAGTGSDAAALNTETVVLRSRGLLERLMNRLSLVEDPEFNAALREPGLLAIAKSWLFSSEASPTETQIRNRVIDRLYDVISVSNTRQSLVFNITVTTKDPEKSALIANALADLYIENQLRVKFEANQRASLFLTERAAELQQTLEDTEARRNAFFERDQIISPEALAATTGQLRDIRDRLSDLRRTAQDLESTITTLQGLQADPAAFAAEANDPQLSQILRQRGLDSPLVASALDAVLLRRGNDLERVTIQIESLIASEATLAEQVTQQSRELIELQQLERELSATRLLYESFLSRLKETNVQQGLQVADSRLLSEAVPRPASSPRTGMIAGLGAILGLMLGSGLTLLHEVRFTGFRTPEEVRHTTGLTVMGSIPLAETKTRKDTLTYLMGKPNSVVAEALRNLRTSLLMSNIDTPPQVILVTSSIPGEGKTTLTMGLANNFKGLGKRVLLIEADIRRCTFAQYFDTSRTPSLLQVLQSPDVIKTADLNIPELGVDVLVGAKSDVNAGDLFASKRFADLIASARKHYDYIIIDCPPVLAVSDARIIRPVADACLYVVQWNCTTRTQLQQGVGMFSSMGLDVTGIVLNQVNSREMARYGYGGEYGYDAYKSKYYDQ